MYKPGFQGDVHECPFVDQSCKSRPSPTKRGTCQSHLLGKPSISSSCPFAHRLFLAMTCLLCICHMLSIIWSTKDLPYQCNSKVNPWASRRPNLHAQKRVFELYASILSCLRQTWPYLKSTHSSRVIFTSIAYHIIIEELGFKDTALVPSDANT